MGDINEIRAFAKVKEWQRRLMFIALLFSLFTTAGCGQGWEERTGQLNQEASVDGRWRAPAEVLAFGDTQDVSYTGAGPWNGESSCQGAMTDGADILRKYVNEFFAQVSQVGGYSCRHINGDSSQTSVHATGRALDIHIPMVSGNLADNDLGDPIAHWLILNAERIGIQLIIWDRTIWSPSRPDGMKERKYGGAHPHNDHLHIELSVEGGKTNTDFFSDPWIAPEIFSCEELPEEGGILDNGNACMQLIGPSKYWRQEGSGGYGESFAWTNAQQSDTYSNAAIWQIKLAKAGDYEVEVYLPSEFSVYDKVQYVVSHSGQKSEVMLDQSQSKEWTSLGVFAFDTATGQKVSLFDNNNQAVADDLHIAADALRLILVTDSGDTSGGCGCQSTSRGSTGGIGLLWSLLVMLGLFWTGRSKVEKTNNKGKQRGRLKI